MTIQNVLAEKVATEALARPDHKPVSPVPGGQAATPKGGPRNMFLPTVKTTVGWRTTFLAL